VGQDGRIFSTAADYEFVICVCANGGFGFSEFIPWSALKPAPKRNQSSNHPPTPEGNTMKINTLFAAIALTAAAASLPVLAQEATYDYPQAATSQVSRQAVLADLALARAGGSLQVNEASVGAVQTAAVPRYLGQGNMGRGNMGQRNLAERNLAKQSRQAVRNDGQQAANRAHTAALTAEPHDFTVDLPQAAWVAVAGK
jgi:hypothetical protein